MKTKQEISTDVDTWIWQEDLPTRARLKPIRKFDGLYPDDPEEAEAYWDFIKWAMNAHNAVILEIKVKQTDLNRYGMDTHILSA